MKFLPPSPALIEARRILNLSPDQQLRELRKHEMGRKPKPDRRYDALGKAFLDRIQDPRATAAELKTLGAEIRTATYGGKLTTTAAKRLFGKLKRAMDSALLREERAAQQPGAQTYIPRS